MAFSIEAGQPIDEFMRAEQDTVAEQYNTIYDMRLESVDTLKEIYVSLVSAGLFALVIAGIHLVLFEMVPLIQHLLKLQQGYDIS